MLKKTFNFNYTCDRCGKKDTYVHWDENWSSRGWYELNGYAGRNHSIEPLHFCRECFRDVFGNGGSAWLDEDVEEGKLTSIDLSDYTYIKDGAKHSKDITWTCYSGDDEDMCIGLTD